METKNSTIRQQSESQPNCYMLYANCLVTRGTERAIITDVQKNIYFFIPLSLAEMLDGNRWNVTNSLNEYPGQEDVIYEYLYMLIEKDVVYPLSDQERDFFPPLSLAWSYPSHASNIVIDISQDSFEWTDLIEQIEECVCLNVMLISYENKTMSELKKVINHFDESLVQSIDMHLVYDAEFDFNDLLDYLEPKKRIRCIIFFDSPEFEQMSFYESGLGAVIMVQNSLEGVNQCGVVHHSYFNTQIPHFTEAQQHNTCLNRKIAIDAEGNIKNCPSMTKSYGNIRDTTLMEAIEKPGFKDCWTIRKDDTVKCKDCEFRYICTDCRAYTDDPEHALTPDAEGLYSAPLKCGYDPYTCTWEEWSTHPLKQKAIDFYEMRDIL